MASKTINRMGGNPKSTHFILEIMKAKFNYNSCGVCTNPEIVFHTMKEGALAWDYVDIEISETKGKWIWGSSTCGGGQPCSVVGDSFDNKEDCILDALNDVKRILTKNASTEDQPFSKNAQRYLDALIVWENNRNQLSLF